MAATARVELRVQPDQKALLERAVVDALHEQAAHFYERLGVRRVPGSLLLVQRVADAAAALSP